MINEYVGGRIDKDVLNTKYDKVGAAVDIESKIWDCFDFDCDDCVKGNCEGCPLNIEGA